MGVFIPCSAAEFSVHCGVQACEGHTLNLSCIFHLWKEELLQKGTIVIATYIYALKELPLCSKLQSLCMALGP